ncbi:MAG: hypothetical protein HQL73_03405 [Magnetococcales bacterium]|nr:hypothetical protein [Magnetococcales bacterium]
MNNIEVLEAYNRLRKKFGEKSLGDVPPELTPCGLRHHQEHRTTAEEVWQMVNEFAPDQGWICFQSRVAHFFKAENLPPQGVILSAELCRTDSPTSLHIRPHPLGGWGVHRLERLPEGGEFWFEEMKFLSVEQDVGFLVHEVYWQQDGEAGMVRKVSRFCGLQPRRNDSKEGAS